MKKEGQIWLWMHALIGVAAAVIIGCCLCQHRQEFWRAQARSAFDDALQEEMQKWKDIEVCSFSFGNRKLQDDSIYLKKEPVKVTLTSQYGTKDFFPPYEKRIHNIERFSDEKRGRHSCLLDSIPLKVDSLNLFWKRRLAALEFPGRTIMRITVTDWEERDSCAYSSDSFYIPQSDSLFTSYIGNRCEVGVTGYLYQPWWVVLSWKDRAWLAVWLAVWLLVFFVRGYAYRVYRRLFVKTPPVVQEKEVPATEEKGTPIVKENGISESVGRERCPYSYPLEEGVLFDARMKLLKKGKKEVKLTILMAQLLQGFLEAENRGLSNDEIVHLLWPKEVGTQDKLYQIITRLRSRLSDISVCTIENVNGAYRLIIPSPSEEVGSEHLSDGV